MEKSKSESTLSSKNSSSAIAVFDSGVGGLTVLSALRSVLPKHNLLYLGDTARVPYGTKSLSSVQTYVARACAFFEQHDISHIVIACNTASAAIRETAWQHAAATPLIDVVGPGASAIAAASHTKHVAVVATEGTVGSKMYPRAISSLSMDIIVQQVACQLFVALAEEGWGQSDVAYKAAEQYLSPLFSSDRGAQIDALLLGCTHFPMLRDVITRVIPPSVTIIDSATPTAAYVATQLGAQSGTATGETRYFVTDGPERFRRIGEQFLAEEIPANAIETVEL